MLHLKNVKKSFVEPDGAQLPILDIADFGVAAGEQMVLVGRSGGGKTTASRVKSLLLFVEAVHGRAEGDAFLLTTKLDRDYLEDETRLVPVELWHSALVAFASSILLLSFQLAATQ